MWAATPPEGDAANHDYRGGQIEARWAWYPVEGKRAPTYAEESAGAEMIRKVCNE
ncbi:MAG: hypothetical protein WA737_04525 [Candidatus Acidiferrales bacterium]